MDINILIKSFIILKLKLNKNILKKSSNNILFEINHKIYLINFLSKYPNNLLFLSRYMLFLTIMRNFVIEFQFKKINNLIK